MTPTASSSSILLLNPAASAGSGIAPTDAQAAPDVGLGGFELLLGAIQQLQQELSTAIGDGDAESDSGQGEDESSGNAFPALGTLLPSVLPLSGKTAGASTTNATNEELSTDNSADKKDTLSQEVDGAGVDLLFSALQPTPVFANNSTNTSANSQGINTSAQTAVDGISTMATTDELTSQTATTAVTVTATTTPNMATTNVATANSVTANKESNSKNDRSGAASLKLGLAEAGSASIDTAKANNADTRALVQKSPDVAPAAESDFDILVKHFETPASSQVTSVPAGVGESAFVRESTLVNHASRTYANAMNSNAAVPVLVGSNGWGDAIADKVMWFSANKITSAEIHLNPPDLGPLQVRVSTQQDQASVVFTSQHAAVRDALDQALPRLRDMMGNQGMQLLDVSVGGQTSQQQQQQFARNDSSPNGSQFANVFGEDEVDTKAANVTPINTARLLRSGVDAYA